VTIREGKYRREAGQPPGGPRDRRVERALPSDRLVDHRRNSSQIVDGASVLLVMSRTKVDALGHPLRAWGARLMTTMLHALEDNDQQFGLQLMCEAGGMANATVIERR
jgi:acetyl-CoA acetyltransferase